MLSNEIHVCGVFQLGENTHHLLTGAQSLEDLSYPRTQVNQLTPLNARGAARPGDQDARPLSSGRNTTTHAFSVQTRQR